MYGRREQAEAHSFLVGRILAAVLRTDPDAPVRPLRRTTVGLAVGIAVAVLVGGVVLAVSFLTGRGSDAWRDQPGTLVVDEDSGNRYLLIDGRLRPVLNYSSARLLVEGNPPISTVGTEDLADFPKGAPVGIAGAPDALPSPDAGGQPWTVCAGAGDAETSVSVSVGAPTGVTALTEDQSALVRTGDQLYLAWNGSKLRITEDWVPRAMGMDPAKAVAVDSAWLNTLPSGPDIGSQPVQHGGSGPQVAGAQTQLGQLVTVPEAVGNSAFVVAPDGLMPVSPLVAALVGADPELDLPPPITLTPAQLATEPVTPAPVWQAELPAQPPAALDSETQMPCVRWENDQATLATAGNLDGSSASSDPAGVTRDGRVADLVDVTPGAGMIARTRPAPGVPGAGVYLITEAGAKFPVADAEAAEALGFSVDGAALVPAELLALLPTGPVLDIPEPSIVQPN
ncbi:type VII secretion protein EccB [Prauserella cavernicola]|uniref:Type VII secretion protein EccB n=1 Tax=Prauserella cavernicola TaxID=2800127 RepID=A0A934QYD1_9PSEU|nr:type VII secretion protein EccB [Prauserella cavernicola]MBK1787789.1 type VII secretion protein EccB [Prauserella cavernicola]